ncbi:MAG: methylated-DNA--[protein]-cysteine S-methyltransferase [Anaerolineales bacterium]|nr:methylated-DNA--[protein]-cysteine S-methyltransferase [Anaerolineales bacterium]
MMNTTTTLNQEQDQTLDYERVAQAIAYVQANFRQQPSLDEIAGSVHLSKYHFQRLFKRWAGISPTQFMHYLTVEYAKERLAAADSVFDTALDSGLSGAGRLHDLFVTFEAMTPGEYKRQAAGLTINYGFHVTPYGDCLIATTDRGICALRFVEESFADTLVRLQAEWPQATFIESQQETAVIAQQIFYADSSPKPLHLLLRGTNFQVQVWRALLQIPAGALVSYADVAAGIGHPTAARAVSGAIAHNPVGYLIPCHRVISKSGSTHKYRWGAVRKQALIGREAAQNSLHISA